MWALNELPLGSELTDLDCVRVADPAGAERVLSAAERATIIDYYQLYRQGVGRPSPALLAGAIGVDVLNALRKSYDQVQDDRRLSELRDRIKLATKECPYCGFGEIGDLDHHLPKALYKAFSIYALNLIPSCAICNRIKPRTPSIDPAEHFLHAYLDDANRFSFFTAVAIIDAASGALVVKFGIKRKRGMSAEMVQRLRYQLAKYRLNDRLQPQMNIYLGGMVTSLEDQWSTGRGVAIRRYLLRSAEAASLRFGENSWRTVLLRGLARCTRFYNGGYRRALGIR